MAFSDRHRLLYELSVGRQRLGRSARWMLGRERQAQRDPTATTPGLVACHSSTLLRRLDGVDMALQRSKVRNLALAVETLDGRVLRPGQEVSFWRSVGNPTGRRGYGPGLVLVGGRMAAAVGGGLCQLSNLLQ